MLLFSQRTAYELRISDWISDVCSSDLPLHLADRGPGRCACLQLERGKEMAVRQADMGDTRRHLQADRASGHDAVGMQRAVREDRHRLAFEMPKPRKRQRRRALVAQAAVH